ncbi:MAG: lamin tail domain-containing protein [Candidatus Nanohaloarchaea archaeon]|nr:lamin tail domain-containing protein [Candidatus Nanohaloarchaea archaeon]
MNIGTIAIIGSILTGLLSVPAAGAAVTGDITAAGATLTGISNTSFNRTPRTVTEQVSADTYTKTIETAFGTVTLEAAGDSFSADLDTPRHHVTLHRSPGERRMTFTDASLDLTVEASPEERAETCTTPAGTLESTTTGGETTTTFSGVEQHRVEQRCSAARATLQEETARIRSIAADLGIVPDVELTAVDASAEHVVITNSGATAVDLAGWTVSDGSGNAYTFQDVTLPVDGTLTVYSDDAGDPSTCDASGAPDYERCWDASHVWNDGGETATLTDSRGDTADTLTYE